MNHIALALAIQITVAVCAAVVGLPGAGWIGCAAATWYFLGREIARAEYVGINAFYDGKRANAPWYVGLQARCWDQKSVLDVAVPFGTTLALAVAGA